MQQIDWGWLGITILWTTGLAWMVAVISLVYYQAQIQKQSFFLHFTTLKVFFLLSLGSLLYLTGLFLTSAPLPFKLVNLAAAFWLWLETGLAFRKQTPRSG